jgi:hypothetical protein
MNLLSRLNKTIEVKAVAPIVGMLQRGINEQMFNVGGEVKLYPQDTGERYISKGYNLNDSVSTIVGKNMRKAGQVRLTHTKVKDTEKKTLQEYLHLSKVKEF